MNDIHDMNDIPPEPPILKEENVIKPKPKPKPVALVPPRMLSDNHINTVSPQSATAAMTTAVDPNPPAALNRSPPIPPALDLNRSRRGRRRKRTAKAAAEFLRTSGAALSDSSSQDNKSDLDAPLARTTAAIRRHGQPGGGGAETISIGEREYSNFHVQHEERPPITFPTEGDAATNELMRCDRQFLKTSGKLLKAAPKVGRNNIEEDITDTAGAMSRVGGHQHEIRSPPRLQRRRTSSNESQSSWKHFAGEMTPEDDDHAVSSSDQASTMLQDAGTTSGNTVHIILLPSLSFFCLTLSLCKLVSHIFHFKINETEAHTFPTYLAIIGLRGY